MGLENDRQFSKKEMAHLVELTRTYFSIIWGLFLLYFGFLDYLLFTGTLGFSRADFLEYYIYAIDPTFASFALFFVFIPFILIFLFFLLESFLISVVFGCFGEESKNKIRKALSPVEESQASSLTNKIKEWISFLPAALLFCLAYIISFMVIVCIIYIVDNEFDYSPEVITLISLIVLPLFFAYFTFFYFLSRGNTQNNFVDKSSMYVLYIMLIFGIFIFMLFVTKEYYQNNTTITNIVLIFLFLIAFIVIPSLLLINLSLSIKLEKRDIKGQSIPFYARLLLFFIISYSATYFFLHHANQEKWSGNIKIEGNLLSDFSFNLMLNRLFLVQNVEDLNVSINKGYIDKYFEQNSSDFRRYISTSQTLYLDDNRTQYLPLGSHLRMYRIYADNNDSLNILIRVYNTENAEEKYTVKSIGKTAGK